MFEPLLLVALLGGLLPALLWLAFWLLEDRCEPEPKRYIFYCFVLGMAIIPLVLWGEKLVAHYLTGPLLLVAWAAIEEVCKFGAAYFAALRRSVFDEPLDAVIYMVTAALAAFLFFTKRKSAFFLFALEKQKNPRSNLIPTSAV